MTQAADRLLKWWGEVFEGEGDPISPQLAEAAVNVVLSIEHESFTTLKERVAKAMLIEFGMDSDDMKRMEFIAGAILVRAGLEHVHGNVYEIEDPRSVVSTNQWVAILSRRLGPDEWVKLGSTLRESYGSKFTIENLGDALDEAFSDVEIVSTIRKDSE